MGYYLDWATDCRDWPNHAASRFIEAAGLRCSGVSPDRRLVDFIEMDTHPFWIGTQAHPEFKSRPDRAHPLFREFIRAALELRASRTPQLFETDAVAAEASTTAR